MSPKFTYRYILLILFAFMIVPVHAQKKGYSKGYIISSEGETVEGWVKDRSTGTFVDLYTRIRFKSDSAVIRKKYGPDKILGYGLNNEHYESVPLAEESVFFRFRYYLNEHNDRVFLKVIAWYGDLTYYHWEYTDDESNYVDYIPLFYRAGSDEMVRVTQGILGLRRNRLIEYFSDCPELVQAIEKRELNDIDEVYDFYIKSCNRVDF